MSTTKSVRSNQSRRTQQLTQDQDENQNDDFNQNSDEKQQLQENETMNDPKKFHKILDLNQFHEDASEVIQAFYNNSQSVYKLYPQIKINQLNNFKNDIDDVVAFELDELIFYMKNIYQKKKDVAKISFRELYEKVLPQWGSYSTKMRIEGRDNYYLKEQEVDQNSSEDEDELEKENMYLGKQSEFEQERLKMKAHSQEVFQMKIDKHFEKMKDIFLKSCTKESRNRTFPVMKLKKIERILDDLSYVCGLVFISFDQYLAQGMQKFNNSDQEIIKKLQKALWIEVHEDQAREINTLKHQDKAGILKGINPILREVSLDFSQRMSEDLDIKRQIRVKFEDEMYKIEKNDTLINFDSFLRLLEQTLENDEKMLCVDSNNEFKEYFDHLNEHDKAEHDENYDPFIQEMSQQIAHYEQMLGISNNNQSDKPQFVFKNQQEKEIVNKIYNHAKDQLNEYLQNKEIVSKYNEMKSNNQFSLETMRKRALQQIFFFYTGQHFKWNLSFDELLEKKFLLDFGEFNIFCKDFEVPLPKSRRQIVFKKCSINHKPHEFEQFVHATEMLASEINNYKIEQMEKRVQEINKIEKMRKEKKQKRFENSLKLKDDERREKFKKGDNELGQIQENEKGEDENDENNKEITHENQENLRREASQKSMKQEEKYDREEQEEEQHEQKHNQEEQQPNEGQKQQKIEQKKDMDNEQQNTQQQQNNSKTNFSIASQKTENKMNFRKQVDDFNDSKFKKEEEKQKVPIHIEKTKLEYEIKRLKKKTSQELIDEFYECLQLHDPKQFRKKLQGLKTNPFNMKDNYQRIREGDLKYRPTQKLTADQIRQKVEEMRNKRLRDKKIKEIKERKKEEDKMKQIKKQGEESRKITVAQEAAKLGMDVNTYMKQRNKQLGLPLDEGKNLKVTLEDLGKMTYKDISDNQADDFKPSDVIMIRKKAKQEHDKLMNEVRDMIDGGAPMNEHQSNFQEFENTSVVDTKNFSERLYAVKQKIKGGKGGTKKVVLQSNQDMIVPYQQQYQQQQYQLQPYQEPPQTERGATHKRGGNQPIQKAHQSQQRGRSYQRGTTPDPYNKRSKSKKKNKSINKSLNRSKKSKSKSKTKSKSKSKSKKRKLTDQSLHQYKRGNSVHNLGPIQGKYRSNDISSTKSSKKSGALGVSSSVANLKGLATALIPKQGGISYSNNYGQQANIMNNKYKASDILLKAQQMEHKQQQQMNRNMANILRLQDKQIEKGLQTARK